VYWYQEFPHRFHKSERALAPRDRKKNTKGESLRALRYPLQAKLDRIMVRFFGTMEQRIAMRRSSLGPKAARTVVTLAMLHGATAFLSAPMARRPFPHSLRCTAKAQTTAVGTQEGEVSRQGKDLRECGFTVLSQPVMPAKVVNEARTESTERLSTLLKQVEAAGFDPLEQQFEFREIATRQRNRWDLQRSLPGLDDDTAWASLCR